MIEGRSGKELLRDWYSTRGLKKARSRGLFNRYGLASGNAPLKGCVQEQK